MRIKKSTALAMRRPIASLARKVTRPDFVSAGKDFRTINLEQVQQHSRGRQSDVWFRLPEGLRVTSRIISL